MVETKWITTRYFLKYIQISSGEKEIQSECRTAECYALGGSSIYLVHNVTCWNGLRQRQRARRLRSKWRHNLCLGKYQVHFQT